MSSDDELLDPWMARVYSAVVDKMVANYGNNQHYICHHPSVETVDIADVTPLQGGKAFIHGILEHW